VSERANRRRSFETGLSRADREAAAALTVELEAPLAEQVRHTRRDLHRFPELGWCEFRTSCKIASTLGRLGWTVAHGQQVLRGERRWGVPTADALQAECVRAVAQGAPPDMAKSMIGGFTGVMGSIEGGRPGPVIALRFDIDANQGIEATDQTHFPMRMGFASENAGVHHNCGHDGHTAIGLGLARRLTDVAGDSVGEIRLIFQPAEEGVRGASAMIDAGVLTDVDYLIGCHIGAQARSTGEVVAGYDRLLATTKFDTKFVGRTAHAGLAPSQGRNALLAAVTAIYGLTAIARDGLGESRINIGELVGGTARNTIPGEAVLKGEVRGETDELNQYVGDAAFRVMRGAAMMHDVDVTIERVGHASSADSDRRLATVIAGAAAKVNTVEQVVESRAFDASDDMSSMMRAVQDQGGQATYIGLGSRLAGGHHTPEFDFDERVLTIGVEVMCAVIDELLTQ